MEMIVLEILTFKPIIKLKTPLPPTKKKKKKDFQQIFVFSWDLLWMKQHCISYSYHYKLMFQFSQDF